MTIIDEFLLSLIWKTKILTFREAARNKKKSKRILSDIYLNLLIKKGYFIFPKEKISLG